MCVCVCVCVCVCAYFTYAVCCVVWYCTGVLYWVAGYKVCDESYSSKITVRGGTCESSAVEPHIETPSSRLQDCLSLILHVYTCITQHSATGTGE